MNFQKMTKQQLKEYGESIGIKLDLKHKKDNLINQLNQQSNFCTECGQDISKSEDSFCFNCGAEIESDAPDQVTINKSPEVVITNTTTSKNSITNNNHTSGGGMKEKFIELNNWYANLNTKQRMIIWVLSIPPAVFILGIPWLLVLIYMEFHRN